MSKALDLTGKRFGKLVAVQVDESNISKKRKWVCICDCGNSVSVTTNNLRSGQTKSCGCLVYETKNQTHGMKQTRIYGIWCGMKKRCNNPNDKSYAHYGEKGIKVCKEWENDFVAFNCWSLLNGYSDELTIDRIDVSKGYSPENCRWITHAEQQGNRTNTIRITIDGEEKTVAEWSKETGINGKIIYQRYHRATMSGKAIARKDVFSEDLCKKRVAQYSLDGKLIKIWDCAADAGRNGYSRTAITQCCRGKLKTSYGYVWKYAGE